jgi:hypothetical protein
MGSLRSAGTRRLWKRDKCGDLPAGCAAGGSGGRQPSTGFAALETPCGFNDAGSGSTAGLDAARARCIAGIHLLDPATGKLTTVHRPTGSFAAMAGCRAWYTARTIRGCRQIGVGSHPAVQLIGVCHGQSQSGSGTRVLIDGARWRRRWIPCSRGHNAVAAAVAQAGPMGRRYHQSSGKRVWAFCRCKRNSMTSSCRLAADGRR